MAKTYEIQGQSFTLLDNNLSLLNKAVPVIAKLRTLTASYTKALDLSGVKRYSNRINELATARDNGQAILDEGIEEDKPITDERKKELELKVKELDEKVKLTTNEYEADSEVQAVISLKNELEGYALLELITDTDFLKPILKKILKGGDLNSLDWSKEDAMIFTRDVVTDFFSVMSNSNLNQ
jgi:hypothetical protein